MLSPANRRFSKTIQEVDLQKHLGLTFQTILYRLRPIGLELHRNVQPLAVPYRILRSHNSESLDYRSRANKINVQVFNNQPSNSPRPNLNPQMTNIYNLRTREEKQFPVRKDCKISLFVSFTDGKSDPATFSPIYNLVHFTH